MEKILDNNQNISEITIDPETCYLEDLAKKRKLTKKEIEEEIIKEFMKKIKTGNFSKIEHCIFYDECNILEYKGIEFKFPDLTYQQNKEIFENKNLVTICKYHKNLQKT